MGARDDADTTERARALFGFALIWCARMLADASLEAWAWAFRSGPYGSVVVNGRLLLVAALSTLATASLLRARVERSVRIALVLLLALLVLRTVLLVAFVGWDAAGGRAPQILRVMAMEIGAPAIRVVELAALAGALAVRRRTAPRGGPWAILAVVVLVLADVVYFSGWSAFTPKRALLARALDCSLELLHWSLALGLGLSILHASRRVLVDAGEATDRTQRQPLAIVIASSALLVGGLFVSFLQLEEVARRLPLPEPWTMLVAADVLMWLMARSMLDTSSAFGGARLARACACGAASAVLLRVFEEKLGRPLMAAWLTESAEPFMASRWFGEIWRCGPGVLRIVASIAAALLLRRVSLHEGRTSLASVSAAAIAPFLVHVATLLAWPLDAPRWLAHLSVGALALGSATLEHRASSPSPCSSRPPKPGRTTRRSTRHLRLAPPRGLAWRSR